MLRIPLNFNRFRALRADVFTRAAADAKFQIRHRVANAVPFNRINRVRRANFGASGAIFMPPVHDAAIFAQARLPNLRKLLFRERKRQNRPSRADLPADVAIVIAIAARVIHARLHYALQPVCEPRWAKNARGAGAHAEMAGRAAFRELGAAA